MAGWDSLSLSVPLSDSPSISWGFGQFALIACRLAGWITPDRLRSVVLSSSAVADAIVLVPDVTSATDTMRRRT